MHLLLKHHFIKSDFLSDRTRLSNDNNMIINKDIPVTLLLKSGIMVDSFHTRKNGCRRTTQNNGMAIVI